MRKNKTVNIIKTRYPEFLKRWKEDFKETKEELAKKLQEEQNGLSRKESK